MCWFGYCVAVFSFCIRLIYILWVQAAKKTTQIEPFSLFKVE